MKKTHTGIINILRRNYPTILALILLIPIFFLLYKIYIPRVNAFGCSDDCNNFVSGYFVLSGKQLFSQIFSNHQPLGTYMSTLIQYFTSPQNIYELVLRHRQFILLFSFFFNALLVLRFGAKVLLFTIIFEFSKFYLFGDRFLMENVIVYPLIYMIGIVIYKIKGQKLYLLDYIFAAVFCWFTIFAREPYIPLVLFIYFVFILGKHISKDIKISVAVLIVLSLITIFAHDIKEYFFDVVTTNLQANITPDLGVNGLPGPRIMQIFFYPIYILFYGKSDIFKNLLLGIDIVFLIYLIKLIKDKSYKVIAFILIALGLANIRVVPPGITFYYAFHMLDWFGIFIFITVIIMFESFRNKLLFFLPLAILFVTFLSFISSPNYFAWEKVDQQTEFITNYGTLLQEGQVIKILSKPTDSLFLDGSDDLIYWQAKRYSHYPYAWYTSLMPDFSKFRDARMQMFKSDPPDFYREYGSCPKKTVSADLSLPSFLINDYVRLETDGKPSCIFVNKKKLKQITPVQWKEVATWHYDLPKNIIN